MPIGMIRAGRDTSDDGAAALSAREDRIESASAVAEPVRVDPTPVIADAPGAWRLPAAIPYLAAAVGKCNPDAAD